MFLLKKLLILCLILLVGQSANAYSQQEAVVILKTQNIQPDKPSNLMNAVIKGDIQTSKLLVDANLIDLNKRCFGSTFLVQAIYNKQNNIAIMLLDNGANPQIKTIDGGNALFYAVKNGQTDVVAKILETSKIDIKKQRLLFRLPLKTTAKRNGYTEIYNMLVKYEQEQQNTNSIK